MYSGLILQEFTFPSLGRISKVNNSSFLTSFVQDCFNLTISLLLLLYKLDLAGILISSLTTIWPASVAAFQLRPRSFRLIFIVLGIEKLRRFQIGITLLIIRVDRIYIRSKKIRLAVLKSPVSVSFGSTKCQPDKMEADMLSKNAKNAVK